MRTNWSGKEVGLSSRCSTFIVFSPSVFNVKSHHLGFHRAEHPLLLLISLSPTSLPATLPYVSCPDSDFYSLPRLLYLLLFALFVLALFVLVSVFFGCSFKFFWSLKKLKQCPCAFILFAFENWKRRKRE
jgi:hypothetical protein